MPRPPSLQPPPSIPYDELPREEQLELLQEQLRRATELVAFTDEFAAGNQRLAHQLARGSSIPSPASRRARALIGEAERALGRSEGGAAGESSDPIDAARQRSILLARRLLAGARAARRDSRRFRWRVARRLAELEERG
jgi:hypothetical protein